MQRGGSRNTIDQWLQQAHRHWSLVDKLGLVNIMTTYHSTHLPTTYARGHRCLDYAYATPHVVNSVERAGYESFTCRCPTDHRSYFVDFSTEQLFGVQFHPLAKYDPRMLKSNDRYQVTEYVMSQRNPAGKGVGSTRKQTSICGENW